MPLKQRPDLIATRLIARGTVEGQRICWFLYRTIASRSVGTRHHIARARLLWWNAGGLKFEFKFDMSCRHVAMPHKNINILWVGLSISILTCLAGCDTPQGISKINTLHEDIPLWNSMFCTGAHNFLMLSRKLRSMNTLRVCLYSYQGEALNYATQTWLMLQSSLAA